MTPRHDPVRMVGTMARFIDIHPDNPQQRAVDQAVSVLRDGGLVAYPTDSGYALGAQLGNADALERIKSIRRLDDKHHFTLVCRDFAQLGQFVHVDNAVFRAVKSATPGPYTFILPATPEVPRRLLHPKKKTVGARIPDHAVVQALLATLGEPLLSSTLILPGEFEAMTEGWAVQGGPRRRRRCRRGVRSRRVRAHHRHRLRRRCPGDRARGRGRHHPIRLSSHPAGPVTRPGRG